MNADSTPSPEALQKEVMSLREEVAKLREHVALREAGANESALLGLINTLPAGIFVKDRERKFLFANTIQLKFWRVRGLDDIIGKSEDAFLPPLEVSESRREDNIIFETGTPLLNVCRTALGREGERTASLVTKVPVRSSDGSIQQLIGLTRDISFVCFCEEFVDEADCHDLTVTNI
jgi:PAS domain-containing protein